MLTTEQRNALRQASQVMYDNGYPALASELDGILSASAAPAEGQKLPPILGVSRVADNPRAVLLILRHEPTDDDLRSIHFALATAPTTSEADKKDAVRYRWLRDVSEPGICAFYLSVGKAFEGVKFKRETVDEAIDAQIDRAAAKGENDEQQG